MKPNEKFIELAKKLKALADRGEGGEKETAERMLKRIMEEHGITLDDLGEDTISRHWFTVRNDQDALFFQIVQHIDPKAPIWVKGKKRGTQGVDLTAAEALKLYAMFEWYWKVYKEEQRVFHLAFIHKHNLYSRVSKDEFTEPTEEQKELRLRAEIVASGLQDKSFQNRIENKGK